MLPRGRGVALASFAFHIMNVISEFLKGQLTRDSFRLAIGLTHCDLTKLLFNLSHSPICTHTFINTSVQYVSMCMYDLCVYHMGRDYHARCHLLINTDGYAFGRNSGFSILDAWIEPPTLRSLNDGSTSWAMAAALSLSLYTLNYSLKCTLMYRNLAQIDIM